MPRPRRDALQSVLLVAALLAGLVGVRFLATDGLNRPIVPLAPDPGSSDRVGRLLPAVAAPMGTRLSLGGHEPIVVDPATGTIARIAVAPQDRMVLFRQGGHTVLVADGEAWSLPAGRAGPRRLLGRAVTALPGLTGDHAWLVDVRFGPPQQYSLVEVDLAEGRTSTRWTVPYERTPVAVLPSGVLTRTSDDDLKVVEPGSGRVRAVLARASTFVDARGDRVAWLSGGALHVRDVRTGAAIVVSPPPGSPDWYALGGPVARAGCCYGLGAFAPDGRTLAVYARVAGPGAPGLALVDLARGRARLLPGSEGATPVGHAPRLAWGSNGWLYFFAAGPTVTSIGAWRPGEPAARLLRLDVDQAVDVVPDALAVN